MYKNGLIARLVALGASLTFTFTVVTLLANHGLPDDSAPAQLLVRATPTTAR
jgi:hypothetical protein